MRVGNWVWVWVQLAAPGTVNGSVTETEAETETVANATSASCSWVWLAGWLAGWLVAFRASLYGFEAFSQHWTKEMLTMSACPGLCSAIFLSFHFFFICVFFFQPFCVIPATLLCGPLASQTLNDVVPTVTHTRTTSITNFN